MDLCTHPRLLEWWKDDPADPDRPSLDDPDVQRLITQLAPGSNATDLGGVLSNVGQIEAGQTLYLDFGFLAHRPRIHDLAYSFAFMVLALRGNLAPERFAWHYVLRLVEEYEMYANSRLTALERLALAPYTAAVPLYAAALDGFSNDPAGQLRSRLPFLRLSEWLLAHPEAMLG